MSGTKKFTVSLISDTHGHVGEDMIKHCLDADEIWHAGDIGTMSTAEKIEAIGPPVRMVWGNIDDGVMRSTYDLNLIFEINHLKVFITHIGGYPDRYYKRVRKIIDKEKPDLYICGHSHILKVMPDRKRNVLHMNPGACGIIGFHKFRTMLKFDIIEGKVTNLRAIELGLRSQIQVSDLK